MTPRDRHPNTPPRAPDVEVLPPRAPEEVVPPWLRRWVALLDDAVRVPGTNIGIGLDALLGLLIPGAGDTLSALGSLALLGVALRRGVPTVVLLRMVVHIAIDALVGTLPIAGDIFDVFFRANRRNLELLERHTSGPTRPPTKVDYAIVALGGILALAAIVLPLLLLALLASAFGTVVGALLAHSPS